MKKLYSYAAIALIFASNIYAGSPFEQVQNDITLIKKCYFTNKYSVHEKKAAKNALVRLAVETGGVILAGTVLGIGSWLVVKKLQKPSNQSTTTQQQPNEGNGSNNDSNQEDNNLVENESLFDKIYKIIPEILYVSYGVNAIEIAIPTNTQLSDEQTEQVNAIVQTTNLPVNFTYRDAEFSI